MSAETRSLSSRRKSVLNSSHTYCSVVMDHSRGLEKKLAVWMWFASCSSARPFSKRSLEGQRGHTAEENGTPCLGANGSTLFFTILSCRRPAHLIASSDWTKDAWEEWPGSGPMRRALVLRGESSVSLLEGRGRGIRTRNCAAAVDFPHQKRSECERGSDTSEPLYFSCVRLSLPLVYCHRDAYPHWV